MAEKVGKGLAKGWRRVGEGLAQGWRRVGHHGKWPQTLNTPIMKLLLAIVPCRLHPSRALPFAIDCFHCGDHFPHNKGAHQGAHATAPFLEGFLEGSLKEVLLRRALRRCLVRVSTETEVLRRDLRRGGAIEGA